MVLFGSVFSSIKGRKALPALQLLNLDGGWPEIIPRSSKNCYNGFKTDLRTPTVSKMHF
jgi:hypothetical protein